MTVHEQLAEQVQRVAQARATHEAWKAMLAAKKADFDAENTALIVNMNDSKHAVDAAEASAKALGLAHFQMTGEKKPTPGLEVKEKSEGVITDAVAGLEWARKTGMALIPESLDAKGVIKIAKVTPLPFVTFTTEPQVQLASDLTPFLPE